MSWQSMLHKRIEPKGAWTDAFVTVNHRPRDRESKIREGRTNERSRIWRKKNKVAMYLSEGGKTPKPTRLEKQVAQGLKHNVRFAVPKVESNESTTIDEVLELKFTLTEVDLFPRRRMRFELELALLKRYCTRESVW